MIKKDLFIMIALVVVYITVLFIFKREILVYQFSPSLIDQYFHSQDITHDVPNRIFLSDGQIHEATGYLYATGTSPVKFNFQHPPLIKYLYGFSTLFFNNPYYAQILLGSILIIGVYLLAICSYKSKPVAVIACLLLLTDPLFLTMSGDLLLDLGQSAFLLLYVISVLYFPKKWAVQGVFLGLAVATKFWGAPLFFVGLLIVYTFYKKKVSVITFMKPLLLAAGIFCLTYIRTFIVHNGLFNIVFFELKTFNYWLHHSVSSIPGASLIVFISGFMMSWWGKKEVIQIVPWSVVWPVSLIISSFVGSIQIMKKRVDKRSFLAVIPLVYLVYLGIQAPFARYFIIILPYLYVVSTATVFNVVQKRTVFK